MNKPTCHKTLNALGMCAKARKLVTGTPMVCESLRGAKKPYVVLCAADNSENTAKKLADKCGFYGVRIVTLTVSGTALADAVGKRGGHVATVAVTDENLYKLIQKTLESEEADAATTH